MTSIMPITAPAPVVNQVQDQQPQASGQIAPAGNGVTINVVENNYINLSNGSVEILNQFNPAPGDTLNLTENNYVQDGAQPQFGNNPYVGNGTSQAGPQALTGASGDQLQQIEAEVGQYMLQMLYNVLYGNQAYNNAAALPTSTSAPSSSVTTTMSASTSYANALASTIV